MTTLLSSTNISDLEVGAMRALKHIGSAPNSAVALLREDDKFMNLLCGILDGGGDHSPHDKCLAKYPIRTTAALEDAMTAESANKNESNEPVKPLQGLVPTEEALAPRNLATMRVVTPTKTIVPLKRKAEDDADNYSRINPHLDCDWFEGYTVFGAVPHGEHLVLMKARRYDTGTSPVTFRRRPFLKMKALPSSALPLETSPFKNDPVDETFLKTLHDPLLDAGRINPAHMIVREYALEVRRSVSGKVFFQCKYCKHLPQHERSSQSTISPQAIGKLYRGNVRFLMNHVPHCDFIPAWIKEYRPKERKLANFSGGKQYWQESAWTRGLRDDLDRKCITYCPQVYEIETIENQPPERTPQLAVQNDLQDENEDEN
ncbi:hypothetical protein ACHAW5_008005 [Stephanodiscus triporus]|uniref:Uncharacterized protein n=1 Tax=Stephanodiscus triporus TaxID=2934178 RepID=A0ABD3P8V0_9STRA